MTGYAQAAIGVRELEAALWASTSGRVAIEWRREGTSRMKDEVWKEYIKNQQQPAPDDDFEVV